MTIKQAIQQTPINNKETKRAYFKRVAKLFGYTYKSVEDYYYMRGGREFVETTRKYDKNDKIISRVEKLQQVEFEQPNGLELVRLSTNETTGQQWKIYAKDRSKEEAQDITEDLIKDTIKSLDLKPIEIKPILNPKDKILRVIYTDVHIGMKIEAPMFGNTWNAETLNKCKLRIIDEVIKRFDNHSEIHIMDFGDFADGYNGQTTRGGHDLPQNMTNDEVYTIGKKFKIELITQLAYLGAKIVCHNVVNDNHSGSFGHIINKGVKDMLEVILPNVEYNIQTEFISHYIYKNRCFIFSHGKDKKYKKFGFSPDLKPNDIKMINDYIDYHNLHEYDITFEKGDSHLQILNSSLVKFRYFNYMPLSHASSWVEHNYSNSRSGFNIMEVTDTTCQPIPYEL